MGQLRQWTLGPVSAAMSLVQPECPNLGSGDIGKKFEGVFAFVLAMSVVLLGIPHQTHAAAVDVVSPERLVVDVDGSKLQIPYERSHPLDQVNLSIERGVIVIHGANRNSDDYFAKVKTAADQILGQAAKTIIIAPQFLEEKDIIAHDLGAEMVFWSSGWRQGSKSKNTVAHPRPTRVSSFGIIDEIVRRLTDTTVFQNLKTIVVAGHSAGGQVVNRYAAGSQAENNNAEHEFCYVVANPSSYVYFNNERRIDGTADKFATPSQAEQAACPKFNRYRYGLDGLNSYMRKAGAMAIKDQYLQRNVVYLLGELDTQANNLDVRCQAMLQGDFRFERGTVYFNYIQHVFGPSVLNHHFRKIVPGVGHASAAMFQSNAGKTALFDSCDPGVAQEQLREGRATIPRAGTSHGSSENTVPLLEPVEAEDIGKAIDISLDSAERYVGHRVRVSHGIHTETVGVLVKVSLDSLTIRLTITGGEIEIPIRKTKIRTLQLLVLD